MPVFDLNLLYVTDVTGMLIALYDHLYKLLSYSIYKYSIYLTNVICTVQISPYPVYQSIMVDWVKWNKDHWLDSCEISANVKWLIYQLNYLFWPIGSRIQSN